MNYFMHETAIVDENCSIGSGTRIWHWVHITSGARIGDNCSLGQNVFVGGDVSIGNNVKIQNNVSIYDRITIEDNVFCGPSMVFTNVYNPRAAIPRKNQYRSTVVKAGATLGANCTIVCGITIGEYAFIGAGTVILETVPAYGLFVGNPGKQIGWMSRYGERLDLPLTGDGTSKCQHTGDVYILQNGLCSILE